MNSIYNEIYGLYYFMLEKILKKASEGSITLTEINSIVAQYGFSESSIYFIPDVISHTDGYNLLIGTNGGYVSTLRMSPPSFMTDMQKGFIKSLLSDKKIRLFLEDEMLKELYSVFYDVEPMFDIDDIVLTETALDSDNYSDEKYISNFKSLLDAIRNKNALKIVFNTSKGDRKTIKIMPCKLEYGFKDDKFRLCGVSIFNEESRNYMKINLGRILSITTLKMSYNIDFEAFIASKRELLPIEIEVSDIRNGFERVFIGLSNYERVSSYHEETGKSTIKIYYTDDDEQELLILLLSFGPAIKVSGPPEFKNKFVDRIKKQFDMINKPQK